MVDLYKFILAQRQQYAVILLQRYHKLCITNYPSSMFAYLPPILNIESLSQSTITSLDSELFGRNRSHLNIQQQTISEVAYTDQ